ncbi:hypothetical protein DAEQUDRAFT_764542 [Daedalea quercina L-15889]|uniref:Uncharacterized protein n=1 Tax=Daedalea quercina L-15889 TaxID=1314783 RepID=A0A165RFB0_9APHY|nr:hypothetical protein DAEQUDRAFT_764542 [Daedalea quercina L-15889]
MGVPLPSSVIILSWSRGDIICCWESTTLKAPVIEEARTNMVAAIQQETFRARGIHVKALAAFDRQPIDVSGPPSERTTDPRPRPSHKRELSAVNQAAPNLPKRHCSSEVGEHGQRPTTVYVVDDELENHPPSTCGSRLKASPNDVKPPQQLAAGSAVENMNVLRNGGNANTFSDGPASGMVNKDLEIKSTVGTTAAYGSATGAIPATSTSRAHGSDAGNLGSLVHQFNAELVARCLDANRRINDLVKMLDGRIKRQTELEITQIENKKQTSELAIQVSDREDRLRILQRQIDTMTEDVKLREEANEELACTLENLRVAHEDLQKRYNRATKRWSQDTREL